MQLKDTDKNALTYAQLSEEDKKMLDRINNYANEVLADIDPQKTQISFQLEKLKPIMQEIATEQNCPLEDIFIKYMDLASLFSVETENKFQADLGNPAADDNFDFKL